MLNAFNKMITSVSSVLDFNEATLSGCVDIIVVPQRDGSLKSTPFHVRFGKLKVLKTSEKIVKIHVNDREANFVMKLGEAGEGYFEKEIVKPVFTDKAALDDINFVAIDCEDLNQQQVFGEQVDQAGQSQNDNLKKMLDIKNSKDKTSAQTNPLEAAGLDENYDIVEDMENAMNASTKLDKKKAEANLHLSTPLMGHQNHRQTVSQQQGERHRSSTASPVKKGGHSYNTEFRDGKPVIVKTKKTLRPTTEMLSSLNLRIGLNTVTYTVGSRLQGEQSVTGHIYYWPIDAKVIISDVDGTITKSDVLGQIMPFIGKDWSQPGIAPLYCNIRRNGYFIMYLTSRAIGQSKLTKDFIFSVYQDGKMLPHGPVVLSPDRCLPSLKREVVFRRPEIFKIATLRDIKKLFPVDHNPFFGGFGNRETDSIAYRAVGMPLENIYIVNPKGDISHYNGEDTKSYAILNTDIKGAFPALAHKIKQKLGLEKDDHVNHKKIDEESELYAQQGVRVVT